MHYVNAVMSGCASVSLCHSTSLNADTDISCEGQLVHLCKVMGGVVKQSLKGLIYAANFLSSIILAAIARSLMRVVMAGNQSSCGCRLLPAG